MPFNFKPDQYLFLLPLLVFSLWSYAIPDMFKFDIEQSRKIFTQIKNNVGKDVKHPQVLVEAIAEINTLQEEAQDCIDEAKAKVAVLNEVLKITQSELGTAQNSKWNHIEEEKNMYVNHAADCKIFAFRTQEAITSYNKMLIRLNTEKTLSQLSHIGHIFNLKIYKELKFDTSLIWEKSGIAQLSFNVLVTVLGLLIISTIITLLLRKQISYLNTMVQETHTMFSFILKTLNKFLVPTILLPILSLYFSILFHKNNAVPSLLFICYVLTTLTLATLFVYVMVFRPVKIKHDEQVKLCAKNSFFQRSVVVLSCFGIALITDNILDGQEVNKQFHEAFLALFTISMLLLSLWSLLPLMNFDFALNIPPFLRKCLKLSLYLLTLFIVAVESLGFHIFGTYLIKGMLLSLVIFWVVSEAIRFCEYCFHMVENPKHKIANTIRHYLGIQPHSEFLEIFIFRIACYSAIISVGTKYLLIAWLIPSSSVEQFMDALIEGFTITNVKIYPLRILIGGLTFCFIFIFFRLLSTYIARHYKRWQDKDNHTALATITIYIGFSISVVTGLLVAGVNFSGLALVAGALSVGIGFGLQHIANNFVSGVILLLQSPVRAGDRVVIDGVEGFIKKIRILSTRLVTRGHEDVIIPNSDLLTRPVTNYMYRDNFTRICCKVGVAYGSDVELVIKTLLEVARSHPAVILENDVKPKVFFNDFGSSSLDFELWVVIQNAEKMYTIRSDLNVAIDTAFRKNNITIAFPQLDVHFDDVINQKNLLDNSKDQENN